MDRCAVRHNGGSQRADITSEVDAAGALRHRVAMGTDNGFEIRRAGDNDALGNMVMEPATGRLLGGVGHNDLRSWCFPLNTRAAWA